MKKKFLSLIFAFALILITGLFFTACGGSKNVNYYFTVKVPEHCTYRITSHGTDKDGKTCIPEGSTFKIQVTLYEGYRVTGEPTMKVNGEKVDISCNDDGSFEYSFTPTKDFDVVVEAQIEEATSQVTFNYNTDTKADDLKDLFIKFTENGAGIPLNTFLSGNSIYPTTKTVGYNEVVEFWVYSNEYWLADKWDRPSEPYVGGLDKEPYYNEDTSEYGYHVRENVTSDKNITFDLLPASMHFCTGRNVSSYTSSLFLYSTISEECDGYALTAQIYDGKLTIKLCEHVVNQIRENNMTFTLKINGTLVDIDFTSGEPEEYGDMSVIVINLKKPYEYNSDHNYAYKYEIELNYFDYADCFTFDNPHSNS